MQYPETYYFFEFTTIKLAISKFTLWAIVGLLMLSVIAPFASLYILLMFAILWLWRRRRIKRIALTSAAQLPQTSATLAAAIRDLPARVVELASELEILKAQVRVTRREKSELEAKITEKQAELTILQTLSPKQVAAVRAAVAAILPVRSKFVSGLAFILTTMLLNIIATMIWTLIGSPGRNVILKFVGVGL